MERIVVEDISSSRRQRDWRVFDKSEIRVGRGFENDLILSDLFVAPRHLTVTLKPEGVFELTDVGSLNGTWLEDSGKSSRAASPVQGTVEAPSGQAVRVGRTVLRFYRADHAVAPEITWRDRGDRSLSPALTAWALAAVVIMGVLSISWQSDQLRPRPGKMLFILSLQTFLPLLLWAGVWALGGRLLRGKPRFRAHLTIILAAFAVGYLINWIVALAGHVFMNPGIEIAVSAVSGLIWLMAVLYGHFTWATRMSRRLRLGVSVSLSAAFGGLVLAGHLVGSGVFRRDPKYYSRVKGPAVPVWRVLSMDEAVKRSERVFERARALPRPEESFYY